METDDRPREPIITLGMGIFLAIYVTVQIVLTIWVIVDPKSLAFAFG